MLADQVESLLIAACACIGMGLYQWGKSDLHRLQLYGFCLVY